MVCMVLNRRVGVSGYLRNTLAEDQTKTDFNLKSFGHSGPKIWEGRLPTMVRGLWSLFLWGVVTLRVLLLSSSPFLLPLFPLRMAVPHTELEEVYVCGGGKRKDLKVNPK